MYTITLKDGTRIENLTLNGNNFISDVPVPDSVFAGKLDRVVIDDGETQETHSGMKLVANRLIDGRQSWFILADLTPEDLLKERIAAMEDALCEMDERMEG